MMAAGLRPAVVWPARPGPCGMTGAAGLGAGSLVRRAGVRVEPVAGVEAAVTPAAGRSARLPKWVVVFGWVVVVPPNVCAVGAGVVVMAPLLPLRASDREFPPGPGWGRLLGTSCVLVDWGKCGR